jgi:hypothetical protein
MRVRPERIRRGAVNILFAMMFFAILGMAALVIDLGMVRHTQRVMQSAADTSAIEGLREGLPVDSTGRGTAIDWTTAAFADADINGRTLINGAGPTFELTGAIGPEGLNAAQLLRTGAPYKPALQPNSGNAPSGDIVSGSYLPATGFDGATENADYSRNDGFTADANGNALLVRLRRTDPSRDPMARETETSSSGSTIPMLFGRGTTIRVTDSTTEYNPRVHGFTVRATAIAQATPVRTVGPPGPSVGLEGMTPFALRMSTWKGMSDPWVRLDAATTPTDTPAARLIDNSKGTTIGQAALGTELDFQTVTDLASVPAPSASDSALVYLPIYDSMPGVAGDWLIGFGAVQVSGSAPYYVHRRAGGLLFPNDAGYHSGERFRNVSATVVQTAETALDPSAPLDAIFRANESLYRDPATKQPNAATGGFVLLAPALVR